MAFSILLSHILLLDDEPNTSQKENTDCVLVMNTRIVEKISLPSLSPSSFFEQFQKTGQPLVITDAFNSVAPISLETIKENLSDENLTARHYGTERFGKPKTEWDGYCDLKDTNIQKYGDLLTSGEANRNNIYLAQISVGHTPLGKILRPLINTLGQKTGLRAHPSNDINLWLGPNEHLEPLHFDGLDGTLIQLRGSKRISLFPPKSTRLLYPFPLLGGALGPNFSQVYIKQPDLKVFPNIEKATKDKMVAIIDEGELLFIPQGWWHEVEAQSDDFVCSINRFWSMNPKRRFLSSPRASFIYFVSKFMN